MFYISCLSEILQNVELVSKFKQDRSSGADGGLKWWKKS